MTNAIQLEGVATREQIERLEPEWDALASRAAGATAFDVGSIATAIADIVTPDGDPYLLTCRTGTGALVGLVPLRQGRRTPGRAATTSYLSWHGSVYSPLFDPDCPPALAACADWILRVGQRHPLSLRHIPEGSQILQALPEYARAEQGSFSWVEQDGKTDYRYHGSTRTRRTIRQQIDSGRLLVCPDESPETLDEVTTKFCELHTQRWTGVPGAAEFASPGAADRLATQAARLRASGRCRIGTLRAGENICAVMIVFQAGQATYAWRAAFDPAWHRFSPGRLLLGQMIAAAFDVGCERFVLGRGAEEYKRDWPVRSGRLWRLDPPSSRWRRLLARTGFPRIPAGSWPNTRGELLIQ